MKKMFRFLLIIAFVIIVDGPNGGQSLLAPAPCEFLSSIDISDGEKNATDQSITYNGITFAWNEYGIFDYRLINGTDRVPAPEHLRGCPCLIKPCIRLYCLPGLDSRMERGCKYRTNFTDYTMNILDKDNRNQSVNIIEHFSYVIDRPCKQFVEQPPGEWQLLHTGQVTYDSNHIIRDHDKYTIVLSHDEVEQTSIVELLLCQVEPEINLRFYILPFAMCLSDVCILITIVVYASLPDLLNTHGRSLLGYLCSLLIAYTALAAVQINGTSYVPPYLCITAGCLIYFGFLSSFLWLNIISIDLWLTFRTMMLARKKSNRRIFFYALYAWGVAGSATIFAIVADQLDLPEHMKPGIGTETCFMKENRISQGIYFFVPLALIVSVNAIFFILTALKIREEQKSVSKTITEKGDSHRHQSSLNAEKNNYSLFLRLFVIMGVTWLTESISWAFAPESMYFLFTDVINQMQGLLIFVLIVLKPKIIGRIKERCHEIFYPPQKNETSTTSYQSSTRTTIID